MIEVGHAGRSNSWVLVHQSVLYEIRSRKGYADLEAIETSLRLLDASRFLLGSLLKSLRFPGEFPGL